jgi:hypothetical protein
MVVVGGFHRCTTGNPVINDQPKRERLDKLLERVGHVLTQQFCFNCLSSDCKMTHLRTGIETGRISSQDPSRPDGLGNSFHMWELIERETMRQAYIHDTDAGWMANHARWRKCGGRTVRAADGTLGCSTCGEDTAAEGNEQCFELPSSHGLRAELQKMGQMDLTAADERFLGALARRDLSPGAQLYCTK